MKAIVLTYSTLLFMALSACTKVELPKPDEEPPVMTDENGMLFIGGQFDNLDILKYVDGENYMASTFYHENLSANVPIWTFDMIGKDSLLSPREFRVQICNHNTVINTPEYSDLIFTTDSTHLQFYDYFSPDPLQYKKIIIEYYASNGNFYSSGLFNNPPIEITSARDTVVDNQTFRILELEGNFTLLNIINNLDIITVNNFKSRVAFSL